MNNISTNSGDQIWEQIEKEKKRDQFIRRISRISWGVTLGALVIVLITFGVELSDYIGYYKKGVVASVDVWNVVFKMVKLVGIFGFIIAIISTVGVFLRLRTTSLMEIQQRLANLEQMVTADK